MSGFSNSFPSSITIFGGSGFLGRALVPFLAQKSLELPFLAQKSLELPLVTGQEGEPRCHIRVASRNPEKAALVRLGFLPSQIEIIACNPRSESEVARAVEGSDAVINLIGTMHETNKSSFQTTHVETAARIARLSKEAGVHSLVHLSALGASLQSISRYARSKATGEEAVRAFFPAATILRPSLIYGASDLFLSRFATMARFLPFLPLIGQGDSQFQPVYIGDVIKAITQALCDKTTQGQTFSLTGPQIYTLRELLHLVLDVTKRHRFLIPLPISLSYLIAMISELSETPLLTRDQIRLLKIPNILSKDGTGTLSDLNVHAASLEMMLPSLLMGRH